MRNLRKILAVTLAVAMIISTFTISFAATTGSADKLTALNLLDANTEAQLAEGLSRGVGITMVLKSLGYNDEDAEATEADCTFTDCTGEFAWVAGFAQIAAELDITDGIDPYKLFDPSGDLTKKMFLAFQLRALGYDLDAAWEDCAALAVEAGLIDNEEDIEDDNFLKSEATDIMYKALSAEVQDGSGQTLIEQLIEAGLADEDAAIEQGLVAEGVSIESVVATKVNTLEIAFDGSVDTDDVTLKVTRGTSTVTGEVTWNEDKTIATFTTTSKLIKGTYLVTATSAADETSVTGSTDVVSQFVNQIVILNDVALTGKDNAGVDAMEAYAYYDVLDQYGESVRTTTNITWSSSVDASANRSTGKITLERTDDKAFTYGEQIFLTGVDTKTGQSVQATLTAGQAQALDSIEVAGFVKKGTSEIVSVLPAGFNEGTYYMVYSLNDQNGNPFIVDDADELKKQVTFVSDNVLLIKELNNHGPILTINGVDYASVMVSPGMSVDKGGEVNISAIANRTGTQTITNTVVGEYQILTSFDMADPEVIIADGEQSIEVPFQAYDQNGNAITNFATLARHEAINALTFTASDSTTLKLAEQADGTAKLYFSDKTVGLGWNNPSTTDGIDRTIAITSIVVGGNTSSQLLSIQDKARPMGIESVTMDNVLVYLGTESVQVTGGADDSFAYVDQYGRSMSAATAYAFFNRTFEATHNPDFANYQFGIRATYKGEENNFAITTGATVNAVNNDEFIIMANDTLIIDAILGDVPTTARSGMSMRFDIVKQKVNENAEGVSPVKTESLAVINISQAKSIAVNDIAKVYIPTVNSNNLTGDMIGLDQDAWIDTVAGLVPFAGAVADYGYKAGHTRTIGVSGKYGSETVVIPSVYVNVDNNDTIKVETQSVDGVWTITGGTDQLFYKDLYDVTTARYLRKDASDTVKVAIYKAAYTGLDGDELLTTASKVIAISDGCPVLTTVNGADTWAVSTTNTELNSVDAHFTEAGLYTYLDQYGVGRDYVISYKISSIVESASGYAANNFNYSGNDAEGLSVLGGECGDTFIITLSATDGSATVTKDVAVTLGADTNAYIDNNLGNVYLNVLIDTVLEQQRLDSMK